jgi:hypothetical protein
VQDIDSEQQEAADKAAEARRVEIEDLRGILNSKTGRRFVWRLLERAGVYRTSFNNSGSITAFNEGRRDVGLFLLNEIHEVAPDAYLTMLKEAHAD